jgi:hypothetical protein
MSRPDIILHRNLRHIKWTPFSSIKPTQEPKVRSSIAARAQVAAAPSLASLDGISFKASIDFKFLKDNIDLVVQNAKNRNSSADPQFAVQLYDQYIQIKQEADHLRAERNENSNAMKVTVCSLLHERGQWRSWARADKFLLLTTISWSSTQISNV